MTKRKTISKKTRFEIFKRDSFTCQYCGAAAPDVVLQVDHINPVAGGGDNDLMNLITACDPCNAGKSARRLDDNTIIAKQKAQLDVLNERREQLEMMLQWRQAMSDLDGGYVAVLEAKFKEETGFDFSDFGRSEAKKWLKRHGLEGLLNSLEGALQTYYKGGDPDDADRNRELASKAFNMIPRVAAAQTRNADKPWMKDLFYIRAIIRNRMYCNERVAIDLLEQAFHAGAPLADMQDWAKRAKSWTNWRNEMETWIEELETGE